MAINKPNLSSVVRSQLPEFVREDYETFVAFLEAYYDFLKLNYDINLLEVRDIDNTLEEFIKYFKNEYAKDIPPTLLNDRFLISKIKDYYLSKGSEVSFQILLALLFGKNVTIDYPSRQMLRASDGKWNQDVSVFAHVNAGDPSLVVGRLVDVVTSTKIIRVQVDKTQNVEIEVDRVRLVAPDIYEFYIDRRFFGNVSVGDRMRYSNVFDATILSTTSKVEIQRAGKHFKAGDLYEIKNGAGSGSILKVSRVGPNGEILALEFVKFGIGYATDFTSTLLPLGGTSATSAGSSSLSIGGVEPDITIGLAETTNGFFEQGYINRSDYNAQTSGEVIEEGVGPAFDGTYVGDVVREFFVDNKYTVLDPDEPAVVRISLGPLTKYPGYYTTNDGFLDDAIFIQDSKYYQAFSYVLKIDERLENYKSVVKTLLHPSGMALFGEYDLRNDFDLSVSLESMLKYLVLTFQDQVNTTTGETSIIDFSKVASEILITSDTTGTGTTRTIPYIGLEKPLSTHTIYDGVTSDTSQVSLSTSDPLFAFSKRVNSSVLYDGSTLDDNNVTPSENTINYGYSSLTRSGISEVVVQKILNSELYPHYLRNGTTLDDDTVTLDDANGINTPRNRTHPYFETDKSLGDHYLNNNSTLDTNTVTITDTTGTNGARTMPYVVLNKSISATTLDYDDNLDDETVTVTSSGALWLNPYAEPYPISTSYFLNDSGDYTIGESTFTG